MVKSILEVKNLKKYYGLKNSVTKALNGISFQVMDGEFIRIMGSYGFCKKSYKNRNN